MTGLKMNEDEYVIWVDESMAEEMDETEVCWEIYYQEMPFDHSSMVE